ncbi:MAG: hypothetical protein MPN21_27135 [Thermoanaerobaculia bacterium]|nr:hypothetical protein [Thermoanaerobaculia bacterium]
MNSPPIERVVTILLPEGRETQGTLRAWEESPSDPELVRIELKLDGDTIAREAEEGFFDALCEIRRTLESEGKLLSCYGSSRNVFPSPMIRSMGYAEKAYRLELGKNAEIEDLVSIFDTGPDVEAVSCSEQEAFYQTWLKS